MEPVTNIEPVQVDGAAARAPAAGGERLLERLVGAVRGYAIVALDEQGVIRYWTPGAEALAGYTGDEAVGQSYAIFGSEAGEAQLDRILETARGEGSFEQERWWRRSDAGLVWVSELVQPMAGGGFAVVVRDITTRAEADERRAHDAREQKSAGAGRESALRSEIHAAERRAAFLAEASSILVATSLDFESTLKALARLAVSRLADWCVIHALDEENGQLRQAETAHRDPALEAELVRSVGDTLHGGWESTLRSVISTGQAHVLDGRPGPGWFAEGAAGEAILREVGDGSIMVTPLMGRGRVLGAITFVSRRERFEYDDDDVDLAEELGRRAAIALDNARLYRDAQEANRAKADFLAVISHELRTPLNAIMGYSDLLDAEISGALSDKQRRQIQRIRASARHLLQLIEEILSFARMESGGEEVRPELSDAGEIAEEAAAVMQPLAHAKNLAFSVDVQADSLRLETDPGKARQVLVNLLSNAVKFTERGSVTLRVRQDGDRAAFDVIDTGIGIPAEQADRVFDPFWQAERPNTRRVGGTGLGLSVSRRYVRLLHGELELETEPGRGTRFTMLLPLRLTGAHGRD
jgi:PAS domain S-box-containing protein